MRSLHSVSLGSVGLPLTSSELTNLARSKGAQPEELVPPTVGASPVTSARLARATRLGVIGADALVVAASMGVAYLLCRPLGDVDAYRQVSLTVLPLWLLIFHRYRLYNSRHVASCFVEFGSILHAVGLGALVTALVGYGLDQQVERRWLVVVFALTSVVLMAERVVVRNVFASMRRRGYFVRKVVVIGNSSEAVALLNLVGSQPALGYQAVGLLSGGQPADPQLVDQIPLLDSSADSDPVERVRSVGAGGVLIATAEVEAGTLNRLVRTLTDAGIHVELSSSLMDIDASRVSVGPLGCFPMMYVDAVKRSGWRPLAKRTFDVVVSALLILLSAPVMALAVLAVKIASPGPVLFRQQRVGWRGEQFLIFKLRTMYVDGDERLRAQVTEIPDGPVVKLRNDPRVTRGGHLLRKFSLDELPQLLNVLRGEMSLIGPRPEQPCEAALWTPEQFDRLRVRPGLTGMWQIHGRSSARDTKDRLDLYYVDNWSIWRDTAIMLKTVPVVISSKGAY